MYSIAGGVTAMRKRGMKEITRGGGKGGWGTIAVLTSTEKEENHDTIGWNTILFLINALF